MTGETSRFSAPAPSVASHQSSDDQRRRAPTPTRRRVIGGGAMRSANSDWRDSAGIYLAAAVASAG